MSKARLMQGNEACAEGAVAAGARFFAGYPITPSSEIAELMADRLPLLGGVFIQMEDEIASMAAVIGASLAGVKAFTATSGPGFSLKQENLGFAAMTEVPCVVINVMRGGPSTGLPTSPAQGDVMQARWGTHGDHPVIVLCPSSVQECYELTLTSFNFAEQFRVPVVLLMDEVIGHLREKVELPRQLPLHGRKRPSVPPQEYVPYGDETDGIPPMADFGDGYRHHVTGLVHDVNGLPSGSPVVTEKLLLRLERKITNHLDTIILFEEIFTEDADLIVVAYGCSARSGLEAVLRGRSQGLKVGLLRPKTLWPFPEKQVERHSNKRFLVAEMNLGQLVREVERVAGRGKTYRVNRCDGELITPAEILNRMEEVLGVV